MLNPLTYKIVWLTALMFGGVVAIVPPLLSDGEIAFVSLPVGVVVIVLAVRRLRTRRRIRLPRKRTLR